MKHNYSSVPTLSDSERVFVLEMSRHGDATKAIHRAYTGMSDQAARVLANQLMKRKDILKHIEYLSKRMQEIDRYVEQI